MGVSLSQFHPCDMQTSVLQPAVSMTESDILSNLFKVGSNLSLPRIDSEAQVRAPAHALHGPHLPLRPWGAGQTDCPT